MDSNRRTDLPLTKRLETVVRLTTLGCGSKEISLILRIEASTVSNFRELAKKRLGVKSDALLTRLAIKRGITTLDDKLTNEEKCVCKKIDDGWN